MTRLLLLILIGAATFLIVLYVKRPELIQNFWIWAIGFAGIFVRAFTWLKERLAEKTEDISHIIASKKDAWIKKN